MQGSAFRISDTATARPSTIAFDDWVFHRDTGELERAGVRTRLQDLPRQLLTVLIDRPGTLVSREELIGLLWPKGVVVDFDTSLNSAMRKLRLALGEDADRPRYIETLPKRGYRFIGNLHSPPVTSESPPSIASIAAANNQRGRRTRLAIIASLCLFAILGTWLYIREQPEVAAPSAAPLRLAVLPFENLSPDPANAFFADGMHEEILSTLANRATNLQVISRTTMMTYARSRKSVSDIARELHATHVLEGSVRHNGEQLRVNLQLIDARTDAHVWAQSYDRSLENAISLESQVAAEVSRLLAVKLASPPAQRLARVDPEAYATYLQAKLALSNLYGRFPVVGEFDAIEAIAARAIELDPNFADSYIVRAQARMRQLTARSPSASGLAELRADIDTARRLAGDSQQVLTLESHIAEFLEDDPHRAVEFMRLAESVGPLDSGQLVRKALALGAIGELDEVRPVLAQARRLDPADPQPQAYSLLNLWAMRRPLEAVRVARDYDARYPGHLLYGPLIRAFTGRLERARLEAEAYRGFASPELQLGTDFAVLRFEGRFDELAKLLETTDTLYGSEVSPGGVSLAAKVPAPVAELRGWAKLLVDRGESTVAEGREVLRYVADQRRTPVNDWYLTLLAAEGELFMRNETQALVLAREAIAKANAVPRPVVRRAAKAHTARTLAWGGASDEALDILEELVQKPLVIGPAEVVRDPLYFKPLAGYPRYERLAERLEREIADNLKAMAPYLEGGSVPKPRALY